MKKSLLFFLFILIHFLAQAQTQTIRGIISDKQSEYPLIGTSKGITKKSEVLRHSGGIKRIYLAMLTLRRQIARLKN